MCSTVLYGYHLKSTPDDIETKFLTIELDVSEKRLNLKCQ